MIDTILASKTELYEAYLALRDDKRAAAGSAGADPSSLHSSLLVRFISAWRTLDRFSTLQVNSEDPIYIARSENSFIVSSALQDPVMVKRYKQLRHMRNVAIHGPEVPTSASLSRGIEELEKIFTYLHDHANPSLQNNFRQSEREQLLSEGSDD